MSIAYSINEADVLHEVIDGEAVLLHLHNRKYYAMNPSGTFIWSLIQKGCSGADIVTAMAGRFVTDLQTLRGSVESFINQLLTEGLIFTHAAASSGHGFSPAPVSSMTMFDDPVLHHFTLETNATATSP
jgi:Coenzyme PQQ synthesis protein D (PqqD)